MSTTDLTVPAHNFPAVEYHKTVELAAQASGSVLQMIAVKKNFKVTKVVLTFDDLGTGNTVSVGDGESATRFLSAVDTASAAGSAEWFPADTEGYTYDTDDTIDATINSAAATGSMRLSVYGYFAY